MAEAELGPRQGEGGNRDISAGGWLLAVGGPLLGRSINQCYFNIIFRSVFLCSAKKNGNVPCVHFFCSEAEFPLTLAPAPTPPHPTLRALPPTPVSRSRACLPRDFLWVTRRYAHSNFSITTVMQTGFAMLEVGPSHAKMLADYCL